MKMDSTNKPIYKASKNSVEKALALLKTKKSLARCAKEQKQKEIDRKIIDRCISSISNPYGNKFRGSGFSKSHALSEMRLFLARQEWSDLQRLFPFLLEMSNEKEPIIWKYAMTILLCSPDTSASNIREFLEMCLEIRGEEESYYLQKLLTLQPTEN